MAIPSFLSFSKAGIAGITPMGIDEASRHSALLWFPPFKDAPLRFQAEGRVTAVHVSPDSATAAIGTAYNRVELWNIKSKSRIRELPTVLGNGDIRGLQFSADGAYLVALSSNGTKLIWEMKEFAEIARVELNAGLSVVLAFSPDGRRFATEADSVVKVWRIQDSPKK